MDRLREFLTHLSPRRRRQLGWVLLLMLAGAVAEVVSLGAILPFLAVVARPQDAAASGALRPVLDALGLNTPRQVLTAAVAAFAISAVVAASVRLALTWASQKFVFGVAQELSVAVYSRTLHQPYSYHASHNSSETLAAINKAQIVTTAVLVPIMQAATGAVIAIFILLGLVYVDPTVALVSGLGFGAIYLIVMRVTRATMRRNGGVISRAQKERLQAAGEGLGGIRDVLLDRSQTVFIRRFAEIEGELRSAQAINNFIAAAPRFVIEGVGLVLIAGLALLLSQRPGGLAAAIPVLGALALGAQRLVPLLQQIYGGWAAYTGNGQLLRDVLDISRLPNSPHFATNIGTLTFASGIAFENVRFSYPNTGRPALNGIDFLLPKGARIGFIGKTGSGKSTLMDLVLGLLKPDSGRILIDGVELTDTIRAAWQAQIAHVPQAIYLADATVAENIAFGVAAHTIDHDRVRRAAGRAELANVIEAMADGYETIVGERGIRLSGGQRQRIGIARALYKQASLLVFDEATSALDTATEKAVMGAIEGLDRSLTILIIAHRHSTLAKCDMIFELASGEIIRKEPMSLLQNTPAEQDVQA